MYDSSHHMGAVLPEPSLLFILPLEAPCGYDPTYSYNYTCMVRHTGTHKVTRTHMGEARVFHNICMGYPCIYTWTQAILTNQEIFGLNLWALYSYTAPKKELI